MLLSIAMKVVVQNRRAVSIGSIPSIGSIMFFCVLLAAGCDEAVETAPLCEDDTHEGIVNGTPTNYESWQGVIALMWEGHLACTGTLIDPEVVLSAGHCILNSSLDIDPIENPGQLSIAGGADVNTSPIHLGFAESIVVHPDYDSDDFSADLSMIKLSSPVSSVPAYDLRVAPQVIMGDHVTVVGYGMTGSEDYGSSGIHRMGDSTVQGVLPKEIEIGGDANPCYGDSGGPMFSQQEGDWVVSGVTSHGVPDTCLLESGGWQVNTVTYLGWIDETMWEMTGHGLGLDIDADTDADTDGDADTEADTDTETCDGGVTLLTASHSSVGESCDCRATGSGDAGARGLAWLVFALIL